MHDERRDVRFCRRSTPGSAPSDTPHRYVARLDIGIAITIEGERENARVVRGPERYTRLYVR